MSRPDGQTRSGRPGTGRSRRVLFVHESPDGLGGSQRSMLAEAEALAQGGWQVLIVHGQAASLDTGTSGLFDAELREPDLFVKHPSPRFRQGLRRLGAFLEAEGPQAAHLHLWSNPLLLRWLIRRLPTLATCHVPVCPNGARFHYAQERFCEHAVGLYCLTEGYRHHGCATTADEVQYGLPAFAGGLAYSAWTLRLLGQCQAVIAPSAWQRQMLIADGVAADRVVVLPPPIIEHDQPTAGDDAPLEPPVVLGAGRLVVLKGFHHLLRASARIDIPHELCIVGDGPALPRLRLLADELGIADRTRFVGPLQQDQIAHQFATASVVVVPSLWPETFGMVGPEALLAGTPVIAYAGGGVRDWALPEHGARMVAAGDIARLAEEIASALALPRRISSAESDAVRGGLSSARHRDVLLRLYERILAA